MGKSFDHIPTDIQDWIIKQPIFFVSTAPLSADGLVNCSPKGLDSFRILDNHTVAYLDLTGSGVETIAHLKENERITIMFCAFEGPPRILRLYGKGKVWERGSSAFIAHQANFPHYDGARSIIEIEVFKVLTSCGYAVPLMAYQQDRDVLDKWVDRKGVEGVLAYQQEKNRESLDGLKGLEPTE